jgi:YidC/Oxa1 family membrane protein insertase
VINQTRTLLVVALLIVVYLLWQAWKHDYPAVPPPPPTASAAVSSARTAASTLPASSAGVPQAPARAETAAAPAGSAKAAPTVPETTHQATATPAAALVAASNDVLRLEINPRGGTIVEADLLKYAQTVKRRSPPVQLLNRSPDKFYVAQDGLVGAKGDPAPNHLDAFTPVVHSASLQPGAKKVVATLTWHDPARGLEVIKRYTLTRGSYVVTLSQQIINHGSKAWQGNAYEQLERVKPPPPKKHFGEFYNPENLAYTGAAWYDGKFQKLEFGKFKDDPLHQQVTGGWVAMSQRFFVSAWIPDAKQAQRFNSVAIPAAGKGGATRYLIRTMGPSVHVAPGASKTVNARLYIGPKLQDKLGSVAPGLGLSVNYRWYIAWLARPMFDVLSFLHRLVGMWGVAIILLVLIIQAATFKLTEKQYTSSARMRKLQPRLKALKERFGDDKQKYQQAMMELYKKEKVNPMAGCLPVLITAPIFIALYYVLILSVELRHAAFLWIPDLSAADPLFILPVLYALTMLGTSFLTPSQGMDPTQAKMMKFMPVLFAVLFFFFPAGLTLYYVVLGISMLTQQWYITRKIERADARARS